MKHSRKFLMSILAAALLLPAIALAAPQVELAITAEKEVTVTENGEQVVKLLVRAVGLNTDLLVTDRHGIVESEEPL